MKDSDRETHEEIKHRIGVIRREYDVSLLKLRELEEELNVIDDFMAKQPQIAARLEALSKDIFVEKLKEIEENLTYILQDILGQNMKVTSEVDVKRGKFWIKFFIEKNGHREDILRGQGGSVCNILSVGLRLIAISQLDEKKHRKFVVLDEQDCWLRPDLVPRFMAVIHTIARKLGYQILIISHHDLEYFRESADLIYKLVPSEDGENTVKIEPIHP